MCAHAHAHIQTHMKKQSICLHDDFCVCFRYIEGLNVETRSVSNFSKTLSATPENTPVPNEARLPTQWLTQGPGYHGTVTNALWALRDLMLKDTMTIARTIPFEDL